MSYTLKCKIYNVRVQQHDQYDLLRLSNYLITIHDRTNFLGIFAAFFKYIPKDFITYLNIKRGTTRNQKKSVGAAAHPLHLIFITRRNGAKPWGAQKTPRMDKVGRVDYVIYPR